MHFHSKIDVMTLSGWLSPDESKADRVCLLRLSLSTPCAEAMSRGLILRESKLRALSDTLKSGSI